MSKRKRDAHDEAQISRHKSIKPDLRPEGSYLESVLERSKQALFQALKLARGFERQKLGRRQKNAMTEEDDGDSKRLAAEVAALKTKSITSAPAFPLWIQSRLNEIPKVQDAAQANVQARLFNSQPVKKAMNDCMGNIRASLGLNDSEESKQKRLRRAHYQQEPEHDNVMAVLKDARGATHQGNGDMNPEASFETEGQLYDSDGAGSDDESLNYEAYDARLAASSDDSFGGFSDANNSGSNNLRTISNNFTSPDVSLSLSPESSDRLIKSESPLPSNAQVSGRSKTNAKATTFLPSLTMGGYWSGSEPASDDESNLDGSQRKNRRGQRERRLIAEKKFGQNANHLKKQKRVHDRDQGWDAQKGAQADDGRGKRGRGRGGTAVTLQASRSGKKGAASSSGANSDPVGPRKGAGKSKSAEGPLHPSWQAAKMAKEQKKAASFQGKKVVFD
ncbi:MAG: hypothetical protein LQ338_002006 [Usnochroma carphineum]|nr:MAG: hypothetical protein LQ338_002006 [Usnochroma carphineum]